MHKKICVIGYVHGRTNWQKIDFSQYDSIVIMGDYFDPYEYNVSYDAQLENFQKILDFKANNPYRCILLFGNHDWHYLEASRGEKYSRYQGYLNSEYSLGEKLQNLLNLGILQIAYTEPGTDLFFVHSTLSARWYNLHVLHKNVLDAEESGVIEIAPSDQARLQLEARLNDLPIETYCFADVYWDVYGYDERQGPLWWRCLNQWGEGLQEKYIMRGITQVNGHTQRPGLEVYNCESGAKVALVDILGKNKYTEIEIADGTVRFTEKSI